MQSSQVCTFYRAYFMNLSTSMMVTFMKKKKNTFIYLLQFLITIFITLDLKPASSIIKILIVPYIVIHYIFSLKKN